MKQSGIVWTAKTLDRFLSSPIKMVPGTTMTYDGVPKKTEREDLIAYLQYANSSAECRK
jgi:cytochrome c